MPRVAYVYAGEGAGRRSVLSALEALRASLPGIEARTLDAGELLGGGWRADCALLYLPGGADLPYCKALNGRGNELIKEYVRSGGAYLGLCAGGYYACSRIEFQLGTELEVRGPRELAFFPGLARGSHHPGFEYQTEAGAHAAPLLFQAGGGWAECLDYSNGGPAFLCDAGREGEAQVLAVYAEGSREAAAVRCQVGQGVAVLCGTHPELAPRWLDPACDAALVQAARPERPAAEVAALVATAREVRQRMQHDAAARARFWEALLAACGLAAELRQRA